MLYVELKKLSYGNSAEYANEYLRRFNSDRAIKLEFYVGDKQAFFLKNADVMELAYNIASLDKKIGELCRKLPGVAINQYSKKCLIDEIVVTNKIEGVHSSRKEIDDTLDVLERQSSSKGKHNRFHGLINKFLKLIKHEKLSLQNCQDIRNIYDEVFLMEILSEDPSNKPDGKIFRKSLASVHSETDKVIHNGLSPECKIIEAMQQAIDFLNDENVDELFRICIFHYLLEYIHPFYDGNGRLGRFILSYGISNVLEPLIAFRLSGTIKDNINVYYKAFRACNDSRNLGDLTPFLLMQLNMIYTSMGELKNSLEKRLVTWNKYEESIERYCENDKLLRKMYSYLIQAALFSEKGISMRELEREFSASNYIVKNILNKIPVEFIRVNTKKKFKYYSINLDKLNDEILKGEIDSISNGEK